MTPEEAKADKKEEAKKAAKKIEEQGPISITSLHPKLAKLGAPFKSSKAVKLSEIDADYVVACVKHTFLQNVVFQFNITNKVATQKLGNVTVEMDMQDVEGISDQYSEIAIPALDYETTGSAFLVFDKAADVFPIGKIANVLKYSISERDPETGEASTETEDDDFQLEDLRLSITDYVADATVNFKDAWEAAKDNELQRSVKTVTKTELQSAIDKFIAKSGLTSLNDKKVPPKKNSHTVYLAGQLSSNDQVLVAAQLTEENGGVITKIAVRSFNAKLAADVMSVLEKK